MFSQSLFHKYKCCHYRRLLNEILILRRYYNCTLLNSLILLQTIGYKYIEDNKEVKVIQYFTNYTTKTKKTINIKFNRVNGNNNLDCDHEIKFLTRYF